MVSMLLSGGRSVAGHLHLSPAALEWSDFALLPTVTRNPDGPGATVIGRFSFSFGGPSATEPEYVPLLLHSMHAL